MPVIDGGLLDEDVDVPDPDDDELDDEVVEDVLPPLEVDEAPTDEPLLAAVEPFNAFTALFATLATLATLPRLGALVDDPVLLLPLAAPNGFRAGPFSVECADFV